MTLMRGEAAPRHAHAAREPARWPARSTRARLPAAGPAARARRLAPRPVGCPHDRAPAPIRPAPPPTSFLPLPPQVVTTLTTVGFGDVVVQTALGRAIIIATICIGGCGCEAGAGARQARCRRHCHRLLRWVGGWVGGWVGPHPREPGAEWAGRAGGLVGAARRHRRPPSAWEGGWVGQGEGVGVWVDGCSSVFLSCPCLCFCP